MATQHPNGSPPKRADQWESDESTSMTPRRALQRVASTPGRTRVLRVLLDGPRTTCAIAEILQISPATASNHLAALHALGLVSSTASGRNRIHSVQADFDTSSLSEERTTLAVCYRSCCRDGSPSQGEWHNPDVR
ncbi:ArsR/SmtB family transcription factor [Sinomonas terricola]|uniref:ArsR/SmtB family transcription factor n=1 Tax=Sinomonas terricola TaxID=3110330 RepID=UPI003D16578C